METLLATLKFSLAGAFLCLDRTAWGQLMFSRPLVAGTIIGWLGGSAVLGLKVGALLELLWLHELPVGCAIPTDDTLVAVLASGVVTTIAVRQQLSDPYLTGSLIFLVLAILFCLAPLSRQLDTLIRNRNADLLVDMETRLLYGRPEQAVRILGLELPGPAGGRRPAGAAGSPAARPVAGPPAPAADLLPGNLSAAGHRSGADRDQPQTRPADFHCFGLCFRDLLKRRAGAATRKTAEDFWR
ncbi:MAG: PTS sugar transporter subunit IIC [Deltaproteobacteria bacterium]|nr:PTS sugar transporter subunit IIC [Deltaproteobacteria bacterium]